MLSPVGVTIVMANGRKKNMDDGTELRTQISQIWCFVLWKKNCCFLLINNNNNNVYDYP